MHIVKRFKLVQLFSCQYSFTFVSSWKDYASIE